MSHTYNVDLTWNAGRKGLICSPELNVSGGSDNCINVATPPEFPKGISGIWSPEHLFTAAINSCLMTTFLAIAENSNLDFVSFSCRSEGRLESVAGKLLMTTVTMKPHVTIRNPQDKDKALRVLRKAEENCLISNSVKTSVFVEPTIEIEVKHEWDPAWVPSF